MDDPKFIALRRLVGQHEKIVYEAVKAGRVAQLPHESQLFAKVMQEHMHLKHVHNALEFADLREGAPYEITVGGEPVNPLAHLTAHAAVKGQLEQGSGCGSCCGIRLITTSSVVVDSCVRKTVMPVRGCLKRAMVRPVTGRLIRLPASL